MPEALKIKGGTPLGGEVAIAGSKNAALPFIAAAILTDEEVILERVPEITDVLRMAEIAEILGVRVIWDRAARTLSLTAEHLKTHLIDPDRSRKLRGSLLFSGALLSRIRRAHLSYPGGDAIGARSLSPHFSALRQLGVMVEENGEIQLSGEAMRPAKVVLEETSVTATENTLLAAACISGKTEIHLAAAEPHVQELMKLLTRMGAPAVWKGVGVIEIEGREKLHGATYAINPDEIEVSSFAALAAATRSEICIRGVVPAYLAATLLQLEKMGVEYRMAGSDLLIMKPKRPYRGFRLQSGLYPKLLSDQIPPFSVLATQASGETVIHEWMYEARLRYLEELLKMGASVTILDPHRALVIGPTPLYGREISSLDVRSGMTLIIAALVAEGETLVNDIEHIDRGYEHIDRRLAALGADIERIKN